MILNPFENALCSLCYQNLFSIFQESPRQTGTIILEIQDSIPGLPADYEERDHFVQVKILSSFQFLQDNKLWTAETVANASSP